VVRDYVNGMTNNLYASFEDLKGRLPMTTITSCLDWNRDSVPDEAAFLSAVAEPTMIALEIRMKGLRAMPPPHVLREIALDWYMWTMSVMWPTHMQCDSNALWAKALDDIRELYKSQIDD